MSLAFLLDTNVVSELSRQKPDPKAEKKILANFAVSALSSPTLEELAYGVARLQVSPKQDMLSMWLEGIASRFPILSYDENAALWLGRERARLNARGITAPRTDGEIAAIAISNGLTLVTRNTADFKWFKGLKVENWFGG
ncbi:MAG: type II toxin-antitoxin system VapC family toxin [Rhodospirillales bacterium]|nr:type II toxin-antitoxin system VapC family toxin [Rhodospirillales bacterium]